MNEFDQFVKHNLKIKNYIRYTDDFLIISENCDYLKSLLKPIEHFLSEHLKLRLHPNKITIRKSHQGVDFLGCVNFPHYRLLRTKTRKRIFRKIKTKIEEHKSGRLSDTALNGALQSYLGVLSHGNEHATSENLKNQFWFWLKK